MHYLFLFFFSVSAKNQAIGKMNDEIHAIKLVFGLVAVIFPLFFFSFFFFPSSSLPWKGEAWFGLFCFLPSVGSVCCWSAFSLFV